VFSIGEVMIIPAEFLLVDGIAPEPQRGAYHGAMGFAALGSAIGPALAGELLVTFGGAVTFAALAGIALLAVVAFGRGRMAPPPSSAGAPAVADSLESQQWRLAAPPDREPSPAVSPWLSRGMAFVPGR
jgi:MFS family permease